MKKAFLQVKLDDRVETTLRVGLMSSYWLEYVHTEMSLTLSTDSFWFLSGGSGTPEIIVHECLVRTASALHPLSQVSPPWLCASRGHPGWP